MVLTIENDSVNGVKAKVKVNPHYLDKFDPKVGEDVIMFDRQRHYTKYYKVKVVKKAKKHCYVKCECLTGREQGGSLLRTYGSIYEIVKD